MVNRDEARQGMNMIYREMRNPHSIFFRITIIFMALILGLICVMTAWLSRISAENHQKLLAEADLGQMEAVSQGLEQNLDAVSQMMTQMLWSKDFCSYMVTLESDDQSRDYRMVRQLSSSVMGENNILKKVWFGTEKAGKVYQSGSYEILNLENADIFNQACLCRDQWILYREDQEQSMETYLWNYEGRLFLIHSLNPGHELGLAICELDRQVLLRILSDESTEENAIIYLFDAEGRPLLDGVLDYSRIDSYDLSDENCITMEMLSASNLKIRKGNIYYYCSERLSWQYVRIIDWDSMHVGFLETARAWVPAIFILVIFALLLNMYLIRTIYQPIINLMQRVLPEKGEEKGEEKNSKRTDAFTALAGAYSDARQQNVDLESSRDRLMDEQERMQAVISQMSPDVMESTVRKLLNGRSYERAYLEQILEGISAEMPAVGRFVVFSYIVEPPANREVSEREHTLYLASIQTLWKQVAGGTYPMITVLMERYVIAAVVAFPVEMSAVEIKKVCQNQMDAMREGTRSLPYHLWMDRGQICNHLSEIRESYMDSLERIQYQRYSAISTEDPERNQVSAAFVSTQASLDQAYFREKAREILLSCVNGKLEEARHLLVELLEEVEHRDCEIAVRKGYYKLLLDEILEKVISYPLTEEEMAQIKEQGIIDDLEHENNEAVIAVLVNRRCRELCQIVYAYGRKNQYKYVEQAKNYIEANYVNSNMALNDVAEHIGISSSYLSELFNEVSGQRFSSYLADYRVDKAKKLLQATTLTITEIGFQCGFNSVQNFIRVFKKVAGYTPGQFRDLKERD